MDGSLARTLRERSWNVPKAERERQPTEGWTVKKEVLVPMSGAPGDSKCLPRCGGRRPSSAQ